MKLTFYSLLIMPLVLLSGQLSAELTISIPSSKTQVIDVSNRQVVMEVATQYMDRSDAESLEIAFAEAIDPIQNPFTLENELEIVENRVKKKVAPVQVVYDDVSILKAIAASLSKQVRGSLSRGDSQYLQLQGGSLLKEGSVIPARIPEIPGQTFNVTVSKVTSDGYTLSINESSFEVLLGKTAAGNSAVRFSE